MSGFAARKLGKNTHHFSKSIQAKNFTLMGTQKSVNKALQYIKLKKKRNCKVGGCFAHETLDCCSDSLVLFILRSNNK